MCFVGNGWGGRQLKDANKKVTWLGWWHGQDRHQEDDPLVRVTFWDNDLGLLEWGVRRRAE